MNKETTRGDQPSVCIVIPVHKKFSNLSENELISIRQCFTILHNYPVFFAGPESIDWSGYEQFCHQHQVTFRSENYSDHFFESPQGYNKLLITVDFYNPFTEFDYLLIYQTDCFVFRDELMEWCKKGYDYIGAPWINLYIFHWFLYDEYPKILMYIHRLFKDRLIRKVGNGGFSLRKISTTLSNLKRYRKAAEKWRALEDSFFAHYIGTFNPFYHTPSVKTALTFSFDAYPEMAYELNHKKLPFACHGWFRDTKPYYEHNLPFWEPIIKTYTKQATDRLKAIKKAGSSQ